MDELSKLLKDIGGGGTDPSSDTADAGAGAADTGADPSAIDPNAIDPSGALGSLAGAAGNVDPNDALGKLDAALQNEGGLDGLLAKLKAGGLGDQVDSWVSNGANQSVDAEQLKNALGPDTVARLSSGSGLPSGGLMSLIAMFLPMLVNMLTPHGQVPSGGLNSGTGGLGGNLGGLGGSTGAGGLGSLGGLLGGILGGAGGSGSMPSIPGLPGSGSGSGVNLPGVNLPGTGSGSSGDGTPDLGSILGGLFGGDTKS